MNTVDMPGKKDYVSIGQNVHKQKRLVLCNLSELYSGFRDKYPNIKIGFSKFCTLRPKWCVLAGSSGTHSVCVGSTHQNAVLLVDAVDWPYTYKDLIKKVVCDPDKKVFIIHHCESCLKSAALKKFLDDELSHLDMDSNSIIVSGKQQIVLYWLHLQQHSKNTRNSSLTSPTTLLDTHTWQKSKQDTWNRKNSLYEQVYDAWGLRRELPVSNPARDTKLPLEQRVLHIASPSHLLQRCWWKAPTLFPVSFQMITHTIPVLFTRFRHCWWNSWSRDSQKSQRSIKFLTVVVDSIKISRTSLIYVPIKKTFPPKQSRFSLQLATGNLRVMELVVQWNTMLQNEVCRDHSTIDHDSGLSCGAGSTPGRNKINDLLWHGQRRHSRSEWEDGEEVQRW